MATALNTAAASGRDTAPGARTAVPGILLNTLPKSGSIYLSTLLGHGLQLAEKAVCHGYFPNDLASWSGVKSLRVEGGIAQTHLDASAANLQILEYYLDRWIVHIRDPRQALLSWVHHLPKHRERRFGELPLESCPAPPDEYYTYSLGRQIDWQIGVFLPQAVRWIDQWLRYAQTMRARVLITTFDELVRSEYILVRTILDFFGVPQDQMRPIQVRKNDATHFRKGLIDEWVEVFTPDQARQATRLIPDNLFVTFGWRR